MLEWHSATSCNVVTKEAINLARQAGRAVNAPQRVFMQQCVLVFSKTSTMKLWGLLFNKAAICSSIRCLFLKQETMSSHSIEHPGPPLFRASFAPVCEGSSTHRYMKTSFFFNSVPTDHGRHGCWNWASPCCLRISHFNSRDHTSNMIRFTERSAFGESKDLDLWLQFRKGHSVDR